jgi:hypothetical protein
MLPRKLFFIPLFIVLIISACSPNQVESPSSQAPQIIKVGLPPTLAYLKESIAACAAQDETFDVLLLEKDSYDWIREPVDVVFTAEHAVNNIANTYLIDQINISIIASQDFPVESLDLTQLQAIFNAEMVSPQTLGINEESSLTIWGFNTGSDIPTWFEKQYGFTPHLPEEAYLAVSPQSVVEKISDQPYSIGYTLSPTITDQVKIIDINMNHTPESIPVIASFRLDLSPAQQELIRCLQSPLSE